MPSREQSTIDAAKQVLEFNDRGSFTIPAADLYPHQWLWDSCFIAMGIAKYDPLRAKTELESLLKAQWSNGMLPHIIFSGEAPYWMGPGFWRTNKSPAAPQHVLTSAMTQPPLMSIACLAVADQLSTDASRAFLKNVYPKLLAYHQWIYRERDPHNSGLATLVHSWESGLDNTPPWMEILNKVPNPFWLGTLLKLKLDKLVNKFRKDTQKVPAHQRISGIEAIKLVHRAIRYRQRKYNNSLHLKKTHFAMEDLTFNSILIAANRALFDIGALIGEDLPSGLSFSMQKTEQALEELWDEKSSQYYPRRFHNKKLVRQPSVATFLPLFSGAISQQRARQLRDLLLANQNWTSYPVPSVPTNSKYFDQHHYWQGPVWVNINWLIIKGLESYGFSHEAKNLRNTTIHMINNGGFHEYFSPFSGEGYGANYFSWTAALYLELVL